MQQYQVDLVLGTTKHTMQGGSLKSLAAQAIDKIETEFGKSHPLAIKHLKSQRFFFRIGSSDTRVECALTQI